MSHERRQLVEKLQVVLAAALALGVVYWLAWPVVAPQDAEGAVVFVPEGRIGQLAIFGAIVCGLAAACAAVTISSRPEGALLAALVGTAALSLRTGPMQALLWQEASTPARLFRLLALEVLMLGVVLLAAILVIALVRTLSRWLLPQWAWVDPLAGRPAGDVKAPRKVLFVGNPVLALFTTFLFRVYRKLQSYGDRKNPGGPVPALAGLLMELAVSVVLLVVTFRSTDRGQILFSLSVSYLVGALVAHQTFPSRYSLPFYLAPLLMAAVVLAMGPGSLASGAGPAWREALEVGSSLPLRAALPADWLAFGCGGAVAGVWFSRRIREARHLEAQDQSPPAETKRT